MRPFSDPNDSYSYEDWMNAVATDDRKPARGWHAAYQERCDCCGRFVNLAAPGVSWSQSYGYCMDGTPDLHDPTYRCSPCTDKLGVKPTNCNESGGKYHGRNPLAATANDGEA